jgi:hypothetical protein
MKKSVKTLQNRADKIWRTKGKDKAVCEVCKTLPQSERVNYTQLHPHHIVGRVNKRLRWDEINKIWLCYRHHVGGNESAHNNPLWFVAWLKKYRHDDYLYLERERNDLVDVNIEYMEKVIENLSVTNPIDKKDVRVLVV